MGNMDERFNLRLDEKTLAELRKLSLKMGLSMSEIVRWLIVNQSKAKVHNED